MKRDVKIIILIIMISLIIPFTSAGVVDWFKTITGKASSQLTNISVAVTGTNQVVIEEVHFTTTYTPIENTLSPLTINVIVSDADGVNDINDTSVFVNITRDGESQRKNTTCKTETDIDSTTANYTCGINMWYWDENGDWNITAGARDLGTGINVTNDSKTFTYSLLKSIVMSPIALTWPSLTPGGTNQKSNNDPATINNTGNYNGTIQVTGINLIGETTTTEQIYAENFTAGIEDECDKTNNNATYLVNNTATTISNSSSNRGNISAGGGAGQEQFYYCIPNLSSILSSQTYSTIAGGSWTVTYP